jgi:DNA-directed RNA polymerase specialized sigma24 family protein
MAKSSFGPGDEDDGLTKREIAAKIPEFEGLIFTTAQQILATPCSPPLEIELDDIRQRLRIAVWRGLESYDRNRDPGAKKRHPQALERYIFQCLSNERKDIVKQVRRGNVYIEDQIADGRGDHDKGKAKGGFEVRYLSQPEDEVFAEVEDGPLTLPSTLTTPEREMVELLCEDYQQTEIRAMLGISVRKIDELKRSIKLKMADWRPSASERQSADASPNPTLPGHASSCLASPCHSTPSLT